MTFKDNPKFKLEFESKTLTHNNEPLQFYSLKNPTEYHLSRYVSANAQNIYSSAGITPELLNQMLDMMIESVNKNKLSDVAVLANNLKYRTKYPVDEKAILRMAMIYNFVDGEDPDKCENHWTEFKLKKILEDPEAYSFFLPKGLEYTPAYNQYLAEISPSSLIQREENLKAMIPNTLELK